MTETTRQQVPPTADVAHGSCRHPEPGAHGGHRDGASGGAHCHAASHAASPAARPHAAAGRTQWTCPVHPEIVRDAPGACPICGMALEPLVPVEDEPENEELRDMTRRLVVSAVLTLPLFVIAMAELIPGLPLWRLLCLLVNGVWLVTMKQGRTL